MIYWDDIVGHAQEIAMLRRLVAADRVPHAVLLVGQSGIGKGIVAQALAASVLCQAPTDQPCGVCAACRRMATAAHPDLLAFMANEETIKIEQMRELQNTAALAPVMGGRRVVILEDAERLTLPAANSLLKILEEPSNSLMFILTASSPYSLLNTIVSRCRLVKLAPAPPELLTAALAAKGYPANAARIAARLSGGRMGQALALLEADGFAAREKALAVLRRLPDTHTLSGWNDVVTTDGNAAADLAKLVGQMVFLLRDMLLISSSCDVRLIYNDDIKEELTALAANWREKAISEALRETMDTARALTGNANARLLSEALLLRLGEYHAVS